MNDQEHLTCYMCFSDFAYWQCDTCKKTICYNCKAWVAVSKLLEIMLCKSCDNETI